MTYTNTITSKGQTTIPKEFRDTFELSDQAQFSVNDRGELVLSRPLTLEEVRAVLATPSGKDRPSAYDQERGEELAKKYGLS